MNAFEADFWGIQPWHRDTTLQARSSYSFVRSPSRIGCRCQWRRSSWCQLWAGRARGWFCRRCTRRKSAVRGEFRSTQTSPHFFFPSLAAVKRIYAWYAKQEEAGEPHKAQGQLEHQERGRKRAAHAHAQNPGAAALKRIDFSLNRQRPRRRRWGGGRGKRCACSRAPARAARRRRRKYIVQLYTNCPRV